MDKLKSFLTVTVTILAVVTLTTMNVARAASLTRIIDGQFARATALSCAMLLVGGQFAKVAHFMEDPVRNPYKQNLRAQESNRRKLVESLLAKALKNKNEKQSDGHSPEIVFETRTPARNSGYLFAEGIAGYFLVTATSGSSFEYTVFDLNSDDILESGEFE